MNHGLYFSSTNKERIRLAGSAFVLGGADFSSNYYFGELLPAPAVGGQG
jgi:hypothetical protein